MAKIKLTKGKFAEIDDADIDKVEAHSWCAQGNGNGKIYAATRICRRLVLMHRFIMEITDRSVLVDHKNGDTLDNRKNNLRIATSAQNLHNSKKHKDGKTSRFKGVHYNHINNNWRARIMANGVTYELGSFRNETEAAIAYNEAADKHHRKFAKTNEVKDGC